MLIALVILIGLGTAGWFVWYLRQPIIPISIHKQLSFSPLAYTGGSSYEAGSYKYDSKEKILSYIIKSDDGNIITVSEQSQPPQFTEIPEYKDKFLDNVMKRYDSVQSLNGVVYLTHPSKQKKQVAVIIDKGLIVFMSANKDLSETEWRKLADNMAIERVKT